MMIKIFVSRSENDSGMEVSGGGKGVFFRKGADGKLPALRRGFLDIDMQGMNGIETGKAIRSVDTDVKIVYLTAYRDYVAGAFGVHAFQYLLKPVNRQEIINVLEEIFRYMEASDKKIILDFRTVDGIVCLPVESIYFFEYENRRIRIVTDEDEYYMVERIGNVAKRMEDFGFSMPHQSFSVNMLHVKNVKGQHIYLDNGMEIPLSQKNRKHGNRS